MKANLFYIAALLGTMVYGAGCSSPGGSGGSPNISNSSGSRSVEALDNYEEKIPTAQNDLGALSPESALEYMKAAENLVIVDVASMDNFKRIHFEHALNIPIEDIDTPNENALYMNIPGGRPVILHCRRGVIVPGAYNRVKELRPDIPEISYIAGTPLFDQYNEWIIDKEEDNQQRLLGGLSPADALEHIKNTPDLLLIEVNAPNWKLGTGLRGAMYIPYTEMPERYNEIPQGRPVMIFCGGGIVSVEAYGILQEKRPDIPELSYIAGRPLIREYKEWQSARQ